jgi:hypothetical protein
LSACITACKRASKKRGTVLAVMERDPFNNKHVEKEQEFLLCGKCASPFSDRSSEIIIKNLSSSTRKIIS